MPGFCFSPTMVNQHIILYMKTGHQVPGIVLEANPAEVVLRHPEHPERLIRVNRDHINAYSGFDEVQRKSQPVNLYLSRCYNQFTRCNGVKRIDERPVSQVVLAKDCPAFNKECEIKSCDFFKLKPKTQFKLLNGMIIGQYPEKVGKDEE